MSRITLEDLQEICLALPGVTTDIKWEEHLCFNIGGKMFLATVLIFCEVCVVCELFFISHRKHRLHRKRVLVGIGVSSVAGEAAISSFRLVASKLSGKLRKELGIGF